MRNLSSTNVRRPRFLLPRLSLASESNWERERESRERERERKIIWNYYSFNNWTLWHSSEHTHTSRELVLYHNRRRLGKILNSSKNLPAWIPCKISHGSCMIIVLSCIIVEHSCMILARFMQDYWTFFGKILHGSHKILAWFMHGPCTVFARLMHECSMVMKESFKLYSNGDLHDNVSDTGW